jgi:prevent-host-death family protein
LKSAGIADLKNNLSRYLRHVRRGEEILIRDRKVPIAKIVPLDGVEELDAETRELVAAGHLRLEKQKLDWDAFWKLPAPRVRGDLVKAISDDREERDASVLGRQRRGSTVRI